MKTSLGHHLTIIHHNLLKKDDRGWRLKAITNTEGGIPSHIGEVYLTMRESG